MELQNQPNMRKLWSNTKYNVNTFRRKNEQTRVYKFACTYRAFLRDGQPGRAQSRPLERGEHLYRVDSEGCGVISIIWVLDCVVRDPRCWFQVFFRGMARNGPEQPRLKGHVRVQGWELQVTRDLMSGPSGPATGPLI
jgi:hypothetical protein